MSLEDYEGYEETAYLMASPKNHERLSQAIAAVESGQAIPQELTQDWYLLAG